MTKRSAATALTAVFKWLTVLAAALSLPQLTEALGETSAFAATGFAAASALKDTVKTLLDHLSDK